MKQIFYLLTITLPALFTVNSGNAQISLPLASPQGSVSTTVGLTEITIDYYRPKMRGRKIFGAGDEFLVPYGEVWRTGANSGTVISFEDDVTIKGQSVEAGEYLVFTKPGADSWEIMLYSDLSLGGNVNGYDKSKEAARFTVNPITLSEPVETLTFNISDLSEDHTRANIELTWENTSVKLPVVVDYDSKVMAAIENNTKVNPANYVAAANYYFTSGKDLEQALEWMNMAIEAGQAAFWNYYTKAQIQKALKDYRGARESAKKSLELAKEAENDFGYIERNENFLENLPKK